MENMPTGPDAGGAEVPVESPVELQPVNQPEAPREASIETEGASIFENPIEDPAVFETEENIVEATAERFDDSQEKTEGSPEEISQEVRWKRAYEEESVKQWNDFAEKNPEKVENYRKEKKDWYEKARAKAEQVMKELDPEYVVRVMDAIVSPDDNDKAEYQTVLLLFESPKGAKLSWSMEIDPSDDYIENRLPQVIKKVYEREKAGIAEQWNMGKRNVEGVQSIKFDLFPTKDEKYLAGEMDRLAKLEEIRESISAKDGDDSDLLKKILSHFNKPKRFIVGRGTMRQRSLEVIQNKGIITVIEKNQKKEQRKWELGPDGKILGGGSSAGELKKLFKDLVEDIKVRSMGGEVKSRPLT